MTEQHDIVVIGAGPAGMAAATQASHHGASVLVLDEQPRPGGQIYRAVERRREDGAAILGAEYLDGAGLVDRFRASTARYVPGATVWQVDASGEIGVTIGDRAKLLRADQIILASGAQERPFPVPGWTLPGVMNAGAAQILLKTSGIAMPAPVFVGTGPLLYLVAHQYLRAGVKVAGLLDTTPRVNYTRALPHLPGTMRHAASLWKGWRWQRELRASGIPVLSGIGDIRIVGAGAAEAVEYCKSGRWSRVPAETVMLHQGVVPNVNLAMAAGCRHDWHPEQACWHARIDVWGTSSHPNIAIAGDGAGIAGAVAAEAAGQIAALGALHRLGRVTTEQRDSLAAPMRRALDHQAGLRRFLDTLYRPADRFRIPPGDDTIVCRCEEVSAANIREAVALGCRGPNQLKSFTRAGMGPCQGRFCGLTVTEVIAAERGCAIADVGAARLRAPVKPLELGQLAALDEAE
ncbi:FAD-dependent oxidoreductase [Ruegeria pomeroyi]|uniref:FAD-dependent oxidoreductase n=1 Tax=Ruegeria pomeroyi TaxID=89184 RepID=A0A9Q3WP89_9RHOB|nr:NAD(P)/FAD-dependent oxidoreductase [Ruegeria pomeroyi]MCE8539062.1 FAD-dependent oxidoreductase [Ruegeria pomeroyi]